MSSTACIFTHKTLSYPKGGGHLWVYLNWALGLRALGCRVIWLEQVRPDEPASKTRALVAGLKGRLAPYGLAESLALCAGRDSVLPQEVLEGCLDVDAAAEADLLLNFRYGAPPELVERFRRTALVDIDPGLLQIWLAEGQLSAAPHHFYFTIGETVGRPGARFPDLGLAWRYTPPCVALDWWPPHAAPADAPFTTVSHWNDGNGVARAGEESYGNDKQNGFLPFMELPRHTSQPLELALCLGRKDRQDQAALEGKGWSVRHAHDVAASPGDYQRYIQRSRGEFSCVKPSCVRLQNAWISDRTLCYLASGKPAVVQHTGPSRMLPDAAGLLRFHHVRQAAELLDRVAADYDRQCRLARALAEEHFDARKVVGRVLEQALA